MIQGRGFEGLQEPTNHLLQQISQPSEQRFAFCLPLKVQDLRGMGLSDFAVVF